MTIKSDSEQIAFRYRCDDVNKAISEYKTNRNVDITLNKHNKLVLHCLSYTLQI